MGYTIMIIDDEQMILDMLCDQFELENYRVITAKNSEEALHKLAQQPDIILLDINMPGMNGLDLCRAIRDHVTCPILFLTARIEEADRVAGLQAGGDDYIMKPFSLAELTARVEAHLRRESRIQQKISVRVFDDIMVDYAARAILRKDKIIELSKVEFDIVELLSLHPGQVFSREVIYERVRGFEGNADNAVVKEHIRRIRNKIGTQYIETVWGCGYKWIK
ncbi:MULTISPECIES: response regulator transcription factor [Oscillospiraceae]|uniref:response regulator transcription factor n=1 Tax=Oscillospiraceae TaxID=216572 RepID=UPI000B3A5681|nr:MULTISPECIES: response regulator transcription factor [Oscillospiraceae]OUQ45072.1 DNA-binding response regulator [Drancourtella sp. An12]